MLSKVDRAQLKLVTATTHEPFPWLDVTEPTCQCCATLLVFPGDRSLVAGHRYPQKIQQYFTTIHFRSVQNSSSKLGGYFVR